MKKKEIDPNRVLDRSENMDRDLENDPNRHITTEQERRDGLRPEDQENEREKEERGDDKDQAVRDQVETPKPPF